MSPTKVNATPIKFTLLNVRSLKSKSLLVREKIAEENIDLFLLTETWLTHSDNACVAECCPPNFSLHHVCRSGKIGGGVGIVARNSLHYSTVDIQHGDSFESLTIRSSNPALPLLTVVYRPPSTNANKFIAEFSDMLSLLFLYKRAIIITGDFNFHIDNCIDKSAISFLDTCYTFGLTQHVKEPTHRNGHTLDLVLSSDVLVADLKVCPLTPSDHFFVSFETQGTSLSKPSTNVTWQRDIRSINKFDLLSSLNDSGLLYPNPSVFNQPDEIVVSINDGLRKAIDDVAPLRPHRTRTRDLPFLLSKKLNNMRREKRKLEHRFKKTGSAKDLQVFKTHLKLYVHELRKSKSSFFCKKLSKNSCDSKTAFKTVNFLLNRGKKLTAPSAPNACQLFSSYFVEKIEKIRASITPPCSLVRTEVQSPPELSNFNRVSMADICKLVKASKRSSSPADPIPASVLCTIIDWVCPSITHAINSSLELGVVPSVFKAAIVRPILKKPGSDPELLSNYRPISLLPFLSKVLEKVVATNCPPRKS